MGCLPNVRSDDAEDLSTKLGKLSSSLGSSSVQLKKIANTAKQLQNDVFSWGIPVFALVFFVMGSLLLFGAAAAWSPRRFYKLLVLLAVVLCSLSFALAMAIAVGSQQLGGFMNHRVSLDGVDIGQEKGQQNLQYAFATIVALLFFLLGISCAKRATAKK